MELEGYEPIEALGESATAVLLRARPVAGGEPVVIKLLKSEHPTPEEVARLAHEHRIVGDLGVAGVVRPLRVERFKHRVGLILEDFGGVSLRSVIGPGGLSTDEFLRLAIPLARTLGELHDADVIHKDLNPSNIVVDPALSTVKITDFGIASRLPRVHREATSPDRLEGTLAYLSPEQTGRMNRAVDHRSDLYALGATFYELLTGRAAVRRLGPDGAGPLPPRRAARPRPRGRRRAVPEALSDIVVQAAGQSPEDRYQSAYGLVRRPRGVPPPAGATAAGSSRFPLGRPTSPSRFQHPGPALRPGDRDRRPAASRSSGSAPAAPNCCSWPAPPASGKTALVGEIQRPVAARPRLSDRGQVRSVLARSRPTPRSSRRCASWSASCSASPPERLAAGATRSSPPSAPTSASWPR